LSLNLTGHIQKVKNKGKKSAFFISDPFQQETEALPKLKWTNSVVTYILRVSKQGCQMVYFQTKNPNFGKILGALELEMLLYFMTN
jgi:hypothetical protein